MDAGIELLFLLDQRVERYFYETPGDSRTVQIAGLIENTCNRFGGFLNDECFLTHTRAQPRWA